MSDPKIIVALDVPNLQSALSLLNKLDPLICRVKVGKELFTSVGPQVIEQCMQKGFEVFLDLKFHDIPNTTAQACKTAASLGVWMINVHALGGRKMMEASRNVLASFARPPKLIAVTILTSMNGDDLKEVGINTEPDAMVLRLAKLAQSSGLEGVVCSAHEAALLRQNCGNHLCLVTPGIRASDAAGDDQSRIMTPCEAILNGASYLVIGRPITQAIDPLVALQNISKEIGEMV